MPTPRKGYFVNGTKVPSVTQIVSRFKDSGALMYWAWEQGKEGKDFRDTSQRAADAGTLAHRMVECDLKSIPYTVAGWYEESIIGKAKIAYKAYRDWKEQSRLKVLSLETPLTSNEFMFGGTPDGIIETGAGKTAIMDIKTSSGVYRDHLLQVAAYKHLWEENNPGLKITGGFHILRFAKEGGDFAHHFYPNLDEAWEMFKHLREAWSWDLLLKKRAG